MPVHFIALPAGFGYHEHEPDKKEVQIMADRKANAIWEGTLKGGRSIVFEAKHTSSDRIMQDAVKLHQAQHLESSSELGAVCFVIVSMGGGFYRVPWEDWKNMKAIYGHKYLNQQEIEKYKIPYRRGIIAFLDNL